MKSSVHLSPEDREFFVLVKEAIFANPFSDERIEIDLKITGLSPGVERRERVYKTLETVNKRLQKFSDEGRASLKYFEGNDRELMEYSFLFDFFHQFLKRFDQLILDQIEAGDTPLKVDFAPEALAFLRERGFSAGDARRYFALCYQLRRAFYFVDHSLIGRSSCILIKKYIPNI